MKHLRRLTIIWLIGLATLFNIEKLDIDQHNIVNIDTFVYLLGFIAVVTIIAIPALQRLNSFILITIWVGIYTSTKFFLSSHPFFSGLYTYLTITEVALLIIPIWGSYWLTRAINEVERAIMNTTLANNCDQIPSINEVQEKIDLEIFYSRASHQPFSVVVVEPKPESVQVALHRAVGEIQQTMMHSYVINSMAQRLSKYLRHTDLILEQRKQGRFIVLCPNTNSRELRLITEYIEAIADLELGVSIKCGTATLSDQTLTFEELISQAQNRLQQDDSYLFARPPFSLRRVEAIQTS